MTDPRTEAHLWIIQALVDHRLVGAHCRCGSTAFRDGDHELHLADALLALFPTVAWSTSGWDRYLTLYGPPESMLNTEPVVPEGPKP